jgi:hypothetical protein
VRQTTTPRARCAAAFVGVAILGASLIAHATPACQVILEKLTVRVVSVTVDGAAQPFQAEDPRCRPLPDQRETGPHCLDLHVTARGEGVLSARLYDPETMQARELLLGER